MCAPWRPLVGAGPWGLDSGLGGGGLASLLAAGEGSGPSHQSLNCVFGSGGDVNNPLK